MSRSVQPTNYSRPIQEAKEPQVCEADDRNKRALYLLNNEWGNGRVNISEMRRILDGDEPDTCDNEGTPDVQPNILPATA